MGVTIDVSESCVYLAGNVLAPRYAKLGGNRMSFRLAQVAKVSGNILAFTALALGSAQFYRVSGATLGPGAFMLSIPKLLGGSLAPFLAIGGAVGAGLRLSPLWLERRNQGAPVAIVAGIAAATLNAMYARQVVTAKADFAAAFGVEWQQQIPSQLKSKLLARRWTWKLSVARGVHVERDVAFGTVPGSDRKLLADVWSPPDGLPRSGLGVIYLHGGGYSAFDKGGPTEMWFRHLAGQGHVVMDVAYRLIPEANVPGMQGDVKRAIAWFKRGADSYGINPDKIVLAGGSAGSHLALLAAYAPYHPLFTPEDVGGMDLSVRGVVAYYNPGDYRRETSAADDRSSLERSVARQLTNLLGRWSGSEIFVDDTGDWDARLFVGGRPDEWPALYRQIAPITHVAPNTPPTLQFMGDHDVYASGSPASAQLHEELRAAGVPSILVRLPRTDHAFDLFFPEVSPAAQMAMYHVDRFLALMISLADSRSGALAPRNEPVHAHLR
jgi:acetyl esterase/lipase